MPKCAKILTGPERYKAMWGGRLGVKTWSMARQLLIRGASENLRWLCTRETMKSIKESVHLVLSDQIKNMGLDGYYDVQETVIYGKTKHNRDTRFVFAGLRSLVQDPTALKAYESFDGAWVEEAQTVTAKSLRTLIPTIRKAGSQLWFSFNPNLEKDYIVDFLFKHPPKSLAIVKTSWRDNLWLTDEMREEMAHLKEINPHEYEHVYEGAFLTQVEGAVFGDEMDKVDEERRITAVPYNPDLPVETYWDIGDRFTSIWFAQPGPLEVRVIDYFDSEGMGLPGIIRAIQDRGYQYGIHTLPWDATMPQLGTGRTIEEQLRSAGFNVRVLPQVKFNARLAMCRSLFPSLWFDGDNCADGIQALRHYRWPDEGAQGQVHDKPLHDINSHPADSLMYMAVAFRMPAVAKPDPEDIMRDMPTIAQIAYRTHAKWANNFGHEGQGDSWF